MKKEFGGYIEFEQYQQKMLYQDAVLLNSGGNALRYLIRNRGIQKIALPCFLCDAVKNACQREKIAVVYYNVGYDFLPLQLDLSQDTWLYLVNYYGQMTKAQILLYAKKYNHQIIVDNAQAYFAQPAAGVDTLYTCRKFFGVSDGAILYTDVQPLEEYAVDESFARMAHLMGRFEKTASEFYPEYVKNNEILATEPIKKMSKLTKNLLCGIDYDFVKQRRTENYNCLEQGLRAINKLSLVPVQGAFSYPLLLENGAALRNALIKKKIYVPLLWPNVLQEMPQDSPAYHLANDIVALPCDQRYTIEDMNYLVYTVRSLI